QNSFHSERLDRRAYVFRLMPHDGDDLSRLQRLAGAHDLLDERPSARAVQHLRERGLQPRTLAGREDHNYEVGICHACIFCISRWNNNARVPRAARIEYFIERTHDFPWKEIQSAAEVATSARRVDRRDGDSS